MHMYLSVSIGEKNYLMVFGGMSYQRGKAALDPFLEYLWYAESDFLSPHGPLKSIPHYTNRYILSFEFLEIE